MPAAQPRGGRGWGITREPELQSETIQRFDEQDGGRGAEAAAEGTTTGLEQETPVTVARTRKQPGRQCGESSASLKTESCQKVPYRISESLVFNFKDP